LNGTERHDAEGVRFVAGAQIPVVRTYYYRKSDEEGVCPFCRREAEYVDETAPGGTSRKMRYECECGAHGVDLWTWEAGSETVEEER